VELACAWSESKDQSSWRELPLYTVIDRRQVLIAALAARGVLLKNKHCRIDGNVVAEPMPSDWSGQHDDNAPKPLPEVGMTAWRVADTHRSVGRLPWLPKPTACTAMLRNAADRPSLPTTWRTTLSPTASARGAQP
jgi:hypothetical protein